MLSFVYLVLIAIIAAGAQELICVDSSNFNSTTQIAGLCVPFLQGAVSYLPPVCRSILLSVGLIVYFDHIYVFVNTTQQSVDIYIASTIRTLQLAPHNCAVYLCTFILLIITFFFFDIVNKGN
jgi:hypothetical protein